MTPTLNLEVILAAVLIFFLTTGGSAVIILFLRKYLGAVEAQVKKMNGSIEAVTKKHDDCRNELPKRFADFSDFKETKEKLFDRLEEVCEGVAFLRGSLDRSGRSRAKKAETKAISDGRPRGDEGRKTIKPKEAAV